MEPTAYGLKADDPSSSHGQILAWAGDGRGRTVLDVGSAQGELAELLRGRGFRVTCVEVDPARAVQARARGLDVVVADVGRDPSIPVGRFDVIVLGDVLEHLVDPARALRGLVGHLAPEGVILVSVPNVAHCWARARLLFGVFEYADRGIFDRTHLRFFTLSSFRRLLADAGVRIERLGATPVPIQLVIPPRFHGRWLRGAQRLQALVARSWKTMFAYQFVALCRPGATR